MKWIRVAKMASLKWTGACLFSLLIYVTSKPFHVKSEKGLSDLNNVLVSIEKILDFYQKNFKSINLDGFFGLRVLEGNLLLLLKEYKAGQHQNIPQNVWLKIKRLVKTAVSVSAEGLNFVRQDNPKYFDDFSILIQRPWVVFKQQRKLEPHLRWEIPQYKLKLKTRLSEKFSDKCMKELIEMSTSKCVVSQECVKIMTTKGLTGYSITHQLLWSILAEMATKCDNAVQTSLRMHGMESLSSMQLEMCTNNFYEMVAVVHVLMKGRVHESHQDLFLEQQFVCPSLGFYEFLKKDYLDQILSWQFPSGCFGEKEDDQEKEDDDIDLANLLETYHNKRTVTDPPLGIVNSDQQTEPKGPVDSKLWHKNENATSRSIVHNRLIKDNPLKFNAKYLKSKIAHPLLKEKSHQISVLSDKGEFHNKKSLSHHHNQSHSDNFPNDSVMNKKWFSSKNYSNHPQYTIRHGRKLLTEKEMTGGCLSHKTGVGAGALIVYLRYLIQPGNIEWNGPHELFQMDNRNLIPSNVINDDSQLYPDEDQVQQVKFEEDDITSDEYEKDDEEFETEDEGMQPPSDHDDLSFHQRKTTSGNNQGLSILNHELSSETNSRTKSDKEDDLYDNDEDKSYKFPLSPSERGRDNSFKKQKLRSSSNYTFSNFIYGRVEDETFSVSYPSTSLVIIISITPILLITFFLCKFFKCKRVHFNYHL